MNLEILTRTTGTRPRELARCIESIIGQSSALIIKHTITDLGNCGLPAANLALSRVKTEADYALILDDDDYLAPDVLGSVRTALVANPPVLFTRWRAIGIMSGAAIPDMRLWGAAPQYGSAGPLNLIVRGDAFNNCIHAFNQPWGGDFHFASELWKLYGSEWQWLNLVIGYHDREGSKQVHRFK
jgi:hypothetical protein